MQLEKLSLAATRYFSKLSARERVLVAICGFAVLASALYLVYAAIEESFANQERELNDTTLKLQNVAAALTRYQKLRARREEVERAFREVEISEGALSYLEELVKTKAGVLNPQINPRDIRDFGSQYEQAPFQIRFPIVDLARLVQFLETLVKGPKPFILASLDIKRRPAGDSLDVELEVSSIRKKMGPSEP
jgi:type II secretory pathway component PulM